MLFRSWPLTVLIIFFLLHKPLIDAINNIKNIIFKQKDGPEIAINMQEKNQEPPSSPIAINMQEKNQEPPSSPFSEEKGTKPAAKLADLSESVKVGREKIHEKDYFFNTVEMDFIRREFRVILEGKLSDKNLPAYQAFLQSYIETKEKARQDLNLNEEYIQNKILGYLVVIDLQLFYEKTYHYIFGSQIKILQFMDINYPNGIEKFQIYNQFYLDALNKYPNLKTYPFDPYLNFLVNWLLIREKDGFYTITNIGIGFLEYISGPYYRKDINMKFN